VSAIGRIDEHSFVLAAVGHLCVNFEMWAEGWIHRTSSSIEMIFVSSDKVSLSFSIGQTPSAGAKILHLYPMSFADLIPTLLDVTVATTRWTCEGLHQSP